MPDEFNAVGQRIGWTAVGYGVVDPKQGYDYHTLGVAVELEFYEEDQPHFYADWPDMMEFLGEKK